MKHGLVVCCVWWWAVTAQAGVDPHKSLVLLGFQGDEISADKRGLLNDLLSEAVAKVAVGYELHEVFSAADFETLANRTQAGPGCDDVTCAAEIGGAFNAAYLLSARAGRLGADIAVTLKLIDLEHNTVTQRVSGTLPSEYEEGYPTLLKDLVVKLGLSPYAANDNTAARPAAIGPRPRSASSGAPTSSGSVIYGVPQRPPPPAHVSTSVVAPVRAGNRLLGWGLLLGATALGCASLYMDLDVDSSKNGSLDAVDFVPMAGYGAAVTALVFGLREL